MRLSYVTLVELGELGDERATKAAETWMRLYLISCKGTGVLVQAWWNRRKDTYQVATARDVEHPPWETSKNTCYIKV